MSDKVTTRARRGAPSEPGVGPRSDESMRRLHDKVSLLSMQRDYWKQRCTGSAIPAMRWRPSSPD